jgi:hypothetical protein
MRPDLRARGLRSARALALAGALLAAWPAAATDGDAVPRDPMERVRYHLQLAEPLTEHFEGVLRSACPRFGSPAEWRAHMQTEVDRLVLLAAHMEEAWAEAKRTGDDEVRRVAKAPRRRLPEAQALVDKLSLCAEDNGASLSVASLYRRLEREVPRRQVEIALPPAP